MSKTGKLASGCFKPIGHSPTTSCCSFENVAFHAGINQPQDDIEIQNVLQRKSRGGDCDAGFILGQFYLARGRYEEAVNEYRRIADVDKRAVYQLAVIMYDGMGAQANNPKKAVEMMKELSESEGSEESIRLCALYNLGRAAYEGSGCVQSDDEAERLWLKAANDGRSGGCVQAMCTLGMFYSRQGEATFNLKKAHYWHQEATGNGSLESQGALGVMYEHGLGVKKDQKSSFQCYKRAAEKGNLFAMGNLAKFYYHSKLYSHCVVLAERLSSVDDVDAVAKEIGCIPRYCRKGVALGCFILARCHERGISGVERNRSKASALYSKASKMDIDTVAQLHTELVCKEN